ncbi:MAG: arginine N-succinyltransferase [Halieaceae bacterium]|nr:arginine N-succinyltransferase [Halieaceae bacterium]
MFVIRPIKPQDLEALRIIAIESGPGFTSLIDDEAFLKRKIKRSIESFKKNVESAGDEGYLLVLEDTESREVVGTTAIEAASGTKTPLYHYHIGTSMHQSARLGVESVVKTLTLCNNYMGCTELCSLYLRRGYRQTLSGKLLSKVRFLLLAQYPERFSDFVIAQMLGRVDEYGTSPFWEWLEKHFIKVDFAKASRMVGVGDKSFVPELMPRHPIYVNLLSDTAQDTIGRVHEHTEPALGMLREEGFNHRGYVDLFDAGPTLEAPTDGIKSVRDSRLCTVSFDSNATGDATVIVCTTSLQHFRAAALDTARLDEDRGIITLPKDAQSRLKAKSGDLVRCITLNRGTQ